MLVNNTPWTQIEWKQALLWFYSSYLLKLILAKCMKICLKTWYWDDHWLSPNNGRLKTLNQNYEFPLIKFNDSKQCLLLDLILLISQQSRKKNPKIVTILLFCLRLWTTFIHFNWAKLVWIFWVKSMNHSIMNT